VSSIHCSQPEKWYDIRLGMLLPVLCNLHPVMLVIRQGHGNDHVAEIDYPPVRHHFMYRLSF
jgi:hypothetical protein